MGSAPARLPVTAAGLQQAAALIRQAGVVAFPTETFYGLAVDPFASRALERLFAAKQRPRTKPILVLIRDLSQLSLLAREIPDLYRPLIQEVWPAPLTLIFPAHSHLPELLTCATGTVGVRLASHPGACRLLEAVGGPVTATSANLSGRPAQVEAGQVCRMFGSRIDLVLDGGRTTGGPGSTVVGIKEGRLQLIRAGAVALVGVRKSEK